MQSLKDNFEEQSRIIEECNTKERDMKFEIYNLRREKNPKVILKSDRNSICAEMTKLIEDNWKQFIVRHE